MEFSDQQAFDLGWDYATFGNDVPENANKLFCDGYRAFSNESKKSVRRPNKYVRKWLQIRFGALRRGKYFSPDITPEYIEKITPASEKCPVIGEPFTFGKNAPTDWSVDRANNDRGYVRGNIIIISQQANAAKGDKSLDQINILALCTSDTDGLTSYQWERLAELIAPAFGDHDEIDNPISALFGQHIALGMPVSPLAGFQIALSRALLEGWDRENLYFSFDLRKRLHVRIRLCDAQFYLQNTIPKQGI